MMPQLKGRRILPVFFAAAFYAASLVGTAHGAVARGSISSDSPKIRVLLKELIPTLSLSGWDLEAAPLGSRTPRFREAGRRSWEISCSRGKVRIGAQPGELFQGPVQVRSPAGTLLWSSRLIRETLIIHPTKKGCSVVNALDMEKYLDGVVNGEFSAKWSAEAIAAQVIAARSYALYQMRDARARQAFFDVDSTTRDQVYLGTEGEETRASQLVAKTRGLILADSSKESAPVKAFYHSTCGGQTDSPEAVWGKPQAGVHGGVRCLHCGSSPRYRWQLRLSTSQINQFFSNYAKGQVNSIEVLSRYPSGRIRKLKLRFVDGSGHVSTAILPGSQFRSVLGPEQLRSTFFDVTRVPSHEWVFNGRGYGHGVGMCQWGAKEMGAAGFTAQQILTHYYPLARLVRAWK